jgi:hypothetical protein
MRIRKQFAAKNSATATGLCFDASLLLHELRVSAGKKPHVENPGRVKSIMARLNEEGIVEKCIQVSVILQF